MTGNGSMEDMIKGLNILSVSMNVATQAIEELSAEIEAHRSRYTYLGWFLYKMGIV